MKIALCDDEQYFREVISDYCKEFERKTGIKIALHIFSEGKEVLAYVEKNKDIDLFILDIKMEHVNGLQVAETIRKLEIRSKIVFLTSVLEYAPEGYRFKASLYWMKPLSYERFYKDLTELYEEIKKEKK